MKPNKAAFDAALDGLSPADCIFIDDQKENIEAAESLGLQALYFTTVKSLQHQLAALNLMPVPKKKSYLKNVALVALPLAVFIGAYWYYQSNGAH